MGWGTIYEVPDSSRALLATCSGKGEWYEALGALGVENVSQLDAEDSIRFWAAKLDESGHPMAEFFVGELHAEYDEYDDPNVCFNGNSAVRAFVEQLNQTGKQFFVTLFPSPIPNAVGDSWLYEPLRDFLHGVGDRGNGVVILWEN
jgi:hypothetical protein